MGTPSPPSPASPAPTRKQLLARWQKWRKRIEAELNELLLEQRHFHALQAIWNANVGAIDRHEIGRWMAKNYIAYACSAIRRLVEPRKRNWKCISVVILMQDVADHTHLFTRARLRHEYTRKNRNLIRPYEGCPNRFERVADRVFRAVAGKTCLDTPVPRQRIERDMAKLRCATAKVEKLVNKQIAHHELDRRLVVRMRFAEIDKAILAVVDCYRRYCLFIFRREYDSALLDDDDKDIRRDLVRLWPKAKRPKAWDAEDGPPDDL